MKEETDPVTWQRKKKSWYKNHRNDEDCIKQLWK